MMSNEGQTIYDVGVRLSWKKKVGNGYTNRAFSSHPTDPFSGVTRSQGWSMQDSIVIPN